MKNKQTAVQWLESEMHKLDYDRIFSSFEEYDTEREKLWEQAKQMEKEQKENAFNESRLTNPMIGFKHNNFEQYYNETYNVKDN
jgi:hypothetical protein